MAAILSRLQCVKAIHQSNTNRPSRIEIALCPVRHEVDMCQGYQSGLNVTLGWYGMADTVVRWHWGYIGLLTLLLCDTRVMWDCSHCGNTDSLTSWTHWQEFNQQGPVMHISACFHCLRNCWHMPLQWCHNGHDGISNHQSHECLLNSSFRQRSKKTSKWLVNSPHKWPVKLKMFDLMTSPCEETAQYIAFCPGYQYHPEASFENIDRSNIINIH